jgi:hypothetical protein
MAWHSFRRCFAANVMVRGGDPDGLERLCRYLTL